MRHARHVVQLSSAASESEKEAVTQGKAKPRIKSSEILRRADNLQNNDTMCDTSSTDDETYPSVPCSLNNGMYHNFLQNSNKKKIKFLHSIINFFFFLHRKFRFSLTKRN